MKELREAVRNLLRGPQASRLLEKFGVDPRRYWLLMDLFDQISERGEMMDQLGRNGVALKSAAFWYFIFSALISLFVVISQPGVTTYLAIFMALTAFLLGSILISEAGNSLINPQEALILAHQPINGATYTAAKLSHLARIILYLVPGVNGIPALAGLFLKGAAWYYPIVHLAAAFTVGLAAALLCCALFGWMVRFVPVRRLKATGQFVGALPFLGMWFPQAWGRLARLHPLRRLPSEPAAVWWGLGGVLCTAMLAAVVLGIRSLSADYLIRVSEITRGGASAGSRARRSRLGAIVGFFGGQSALAGFAFVSRMMMRDWQFRRQLFPILIYPVFGLGSILAGGWPKDPFLRQFSPIHLFPHILGLLLFFICSALRFGNDYKGVWIFLSIPSKAFDGFAGGIFAVLWIYLILIPNLIALPLLTWPWGIWHAAFFIAYSIAAASIYLALELKLIQEVPFGKQTDRPDQAAALLLIMGGGICIAIVVSIQYFLVFRSAAVVLVTAVALAVTAWFATRASLSDLAVSIRYHLGLISAESKPLYKEIEV